MTIVARFLSGGRTASTFAAGSLDMPWHSFVAADLPAAGMWAAYVTTLGYFGGASEVATARIHAAGELPSPRRVSAAAA